MPSFRRLIMPQAVKRSSATAVKNAEAKLLPIQQQMQAFEETIQDLDGDIMRLIKEMGDLGDARDGLIQTLNAIITPTNVRNLKPNAKSKGLGNLKKSAKREMSMSKVKSSIKDFKSEIKVIQRSIDKKSKELQVLNKKRKSYYDKLRDTAKIKL